MAEIDAQEKRIAQMFNTTRVPSVNDGTLTTYCAYLHTHLTLPCQLTGREDFKWEEYYVFGPGTKKEHDKLRKTRASYMDTFELLKLGEDVDDFYSIFAEVKRVSDKRKFTLPLADLKVIDKKSTNYQLIDDYAMWFVNYR